MTDLRAAAEEVLASNRRDGYTIPSPKLYPYQWNWDSGFVAIGLATVDPAAAKAELRSLFEGMWDTGMLPHIVFWDESAEGYFPGPTEWDVRTGGVATSGITQPPIAVTAVREVFERTGDEAFRDALLPALETHLTWWVEERSVDGDLVYVRHPWETGMDDSPPMDAALEEIDPGNPEYEREDLTDESATQERPTDWYYDRFVYLVRQGRAADWDEAAIREECPFLVEDVLTNSLFVRACDDLAALYDSAGDDDRAAAWREQAASSRERARERLWNDDLNNFVAYDRVNDRQLPGNSIAGLVSTFGDVPDAEQRERLLDNLRENFLPYAYATPTYVGDGMDLDRYWRGPVWINTNWLLERGLRDVDAAIADRIRRDSLSLLESNGFQEYFNPETGDGRGSDRFSWSAALYLDWTSD